MRRNSSGFLILVIKTWSGRLDDEECDAEVRIVQLQDRKR